MQMTEQLTKLEGRELHAIARRINEREETIQKEKGRIVGIINATLAEAILQGIDLLKAKMLARHGNFMDWVSVNCPRIGHRQCTSYMNIARNWKHDSNLTDADSIRAALLLCASNDPESDKPKKQWVPYLEAIYRFGKATSFASPEEISQYPVEGQDELRKIMAPHCSVLWPQFKFV
jgi:hypothetical protein